MKQRILALLLITLSLPVVACQPDFSPRSQTETHTTAGSSDTSEPAQEFALPALDGGEVRLSSLRGQWVLVNFWATWCAPCREEMPYLDRLSMQYAGRLAVLAVNMRERAQTVAEFAEAYDLHLPVLLEPDDATLLAYDVRGLPTSYLIDPEGNIVSRRAGPITPEWLENVTFFQR